MIDLDPKPNPGGAGGEGLEGLEGLEGGLEVEG